MSCFYGAEILAETWINRILSIAHGHCTNTRDWSP